MALTAGDKLGPYEILSLLGKGGMGEVYRAHDPRMGRDVAIKIAAERFNERFDREVRAVAALNHPNICQIYDVGPNYLVMELVEGESPQGPLETELALSYARQIAGALEEAHEKGIVHRDLKPGNIKITPSGTVKVLDFGLAKVTGPLVAPSADSPTYTLAAETEAGMILGTASYMAPEQAKGKPVDKRADIWAFGVVLYELLTGERPFQGETLTDTLASVVKEPPDLSKVPAKTRLLVERCLEKDPKKRLRDIGDAMPLLDQAPAGTAPSRSRLGSVGWVAAAALAIALGALGWVHFRERPASIQQVRFPIPPPANSSFGIGGAFAISPDGRRVVFSATGSDGSTKLWIRPIDSLEARLLPGTALDPRDAAIIWSPDSRAIAFHSGGKIKTLDLAGGAAVAVADAPALILQGGAWNRDGVIIFANGGTVWQVPTSGGTASKLSVPDPARRETQHVAPIFLPDGKHFLYVRVSSAPEYTGIYVGSLDAKPEQQDTKRLLATAFGVEYTSSTDSSPGRLLFMREGTLLAQPFDPERLELSGDPIPITEGIGTAGGLNYGLGYFSASSGTLVYRTGSSSDRQLTWLDRQGKVVGTPGEPGRYGTMKLSPDATRAVYARTDPLTGTADIWMIDLIRGTSTRFTSDPASESQPVWSPDGSRVAFQSNRGGGDGIYVKSSTGAGPEDMLIKLPRTPTITDWSRDGRYIVYYMGDPETRSDIWLLPVNGDHKPIPAVRTQFNEIAGYLSSDGRWIAYMSDESGRREIYVQPLNTDGTPAGGKILVSKGTSGMARWRRDGRELLYLAPDGEVMSVSLSASGSTLQQGTPQVLFQLPRNFLTLSAVPGQYIDVTPDNQRFLLIMPATRNTPDEYTVVLNWQAALKK